MAFVILGMPLVADVASLTPKETGVIDLAAKVTFVLPFMLIVGATMSQFSAAIADTLGAGGLIEAESKQRISAGTGYLFACGGAIVLVWATNIFEIITLASRAFALYYLLQVLRAIVLAATCTSGKSRLLSLMSFGFLAVVLAAIVISVPSDLVAARLAVSII